MKPIIITAVAALCLLSACKSYKHQKELQTIDSLNIVIDSIERNLSQADTGRVKKIFAEYTQNLESIKENFDDQKDDSTWPALTAYGIINKPLKNFLKNFNGFCEEISYSRKQLDSLRTDIENGNIPEENISSYSKTEADAVNDLKTTVDLALRDVNDKMHLFDSLNPKIIRIIERLKKNGKPVKKGNFEATESD
mgnify:FL=1